MDGTRGRLSRGDRRRNEKLLRLREAVPAESAVVAIDLAKAKQVVAVMGPDHEVVARRVFCHSPWGIDQMLDWGQQVATDRGLAPVVACEPTGHRWKPVLERCEARGLTLVCVQPLLVHREREREDLTPDRSDRKDATLIGRLARDLRCYLPSVPAADWARLRHLGARRDAKVTERGAARQALRDLLEGYWPAALEAARQGIDSTTLLCCLRVSTDPREVGRMTLSELTRAARTHLPEVGATRLHHRIVRAFRDAASDPRRIPWEEPGACERAAFALDDLLHAQAQVAEVEDRMVGVLRAVGYAEVAASIPGLSEVGAAAILAETGDPARYDSARTWAKHAGLCPRDNTSGAYRGQARTSGRGRPRLRTAAWRAVWGLLPHNRVFADFYRGLTTREVNPLERGQARAACAAKLLRQLWAVCRHRRRWDERTAQGEVSVEGVVTAA